MADSLALFQLLLDEIHIKTSELILPISSVANFPDMGLRAHLFGEAASFQEILPSLNWAEGNRNKVYLLRDCYMCRYFLGADLSVAGQCWLVGPYLIEEPTMRNITELCRKLELPMAHCSFLRTYYKMLPKLKDQNLVEALFRSHSALYYGQESFELVQWEMKAMGQPAPAGQAPESSIDFREFLECNYINERRMMDCISQGNYVGVAAIFPGCRPSE